MCRDVSFEPIGDIVARLVEGLAVPGGAGGREPGTATAQAGEKVGRAHAAHGGGVVQFVPRKGPAAETAGQVEGGLQTATAGNRRMPAITRQTVPLRNRR